MTRTELLDLIRNGENSKVEFKRDAIENRALAKELVAFANLAGGSVLLGIDEGGTVAGVARPKLEEWVMTTCRDKIRPEIIPVYEVMRDLEDGKDVAVVTVERGWSVHHVWHDNHRTYYIRVGSTSREASPEELERLFQQRGSVRAELRPVSGASLRDLDRRRLRDYFERVRQQSVPPDDHEEEWASLLANTELLDSGSGRPVATIAGLLLFGTNVNRFLPHAGVDAAAYTGREKDYSVIERASIRGPMTPLISNEHLVENGLVEQTLEFVNRNMKSTTTLAAGGRRIDRPAYPREVLREALVNALVHRDYLLSSTDIELSIFEDRLEVTSPGRLPNGITPERMRVGCRAARNQLLKDVMRDYGYLEHMGMGIPRKIIKGMRDHNDTEPDLIEDGERFILRLLNRPL